MKVSQLLRIILPAATIALVMQWTIADGETLDVYIVADGPGTAVFNPANITITQGDTVVWHWPEMPCSHSVTSGTDCHPDGLFDSTVQGGSSYAFSYTFGSPGTYPYFSMTECATAEGSVTVAAATEPPAQLLNISTRMLVQTGENVLIGGFIITGNDPKKVLLRAIGPSLAQQGIVGALADPVLELHASDGSLIMSNDNWKTTQQSAIEATKTAPTNDLESAIIATLMPGNYTAIVSGKGGKTGIGLVEGYDLDQPADSRLANISTRGFVETGDNVMIGGFILGNGKGMANVLIRALGPSLAQAGVKGALANPTLDLRDANGSLVMTNDDWKESQRAAIEATKTAPTNDLESAMVVTVAPGAYTAIVSGKNGGTGVALVELYRLQ